jgi:hypothetical protein
MEETNIGSPSIKEETDYHMDPEWVISNFDLHDKDVLNIYLYGSRVYGTASSKSDWDYIIVLKDGGGEQNTIPGKEANTDGTLINSKFFAAGIEEHQPPLLECIFLPQNKIVLQRQSFPFTLSKNKVRDTFSWRVGHSWSKAGKKMTVAKDRNLYIAKKSLFHSFRILSFGIQIAREGRIVDYGAMNALWDEIAACDRDDWPYYNSTYKKRWNALKSELRLLAPKEVLTQHPNRDTTSTTKSSTTTNSDNSDNVDT